MPPTATLLCLRHCQSTGQAPDAPLTASGHAAAQRLADALEAWAPGRLFSSPYRRATQTLAPFAHLRNRAVIIDDRLREHELCAPDFAGWREALQQSFLDDAVRFPGGETSAEARDRALAALADIADSTNRAVIATHGKLLALLIGTVRPDFGYAEWQQLRNPDAFEFTWRDDHPVAVRTLDPFTLA